MEMYSGGRDHSVEEILCNFCLFSDVLPSRTQICGIAYAILCLLCPSARNNLDGILPSHIPHLRSLRLRMSMRNLRLHTRRPKSQQSQRTRRQSSRIYNRSFPRNRHRFSSRLHLHFLLLFFHLRNRSTRRRSRPEFLSNFLLCKSSSFRP